MILFQKFLSISHLLRSKYVSLKDEEAVAHEGDLRWKRTKMTGKCIFRLQLTSPLTVGELIFTWHKNLNDNDIGTVHVDALINEKSDNDIGTSNFC